jgi:RND family efflux transporter MFP subunit
MGMKITAITSFLLLATATASVLAQPVVTVETNPVEREYIAAEMPVSGVIVSREDAAVAAELDGRLTWVIEVGERVKAGDTLAILDTHLIELEQRDRKAEVARLQANLDWFGRQTQRLDELANKNNTAHAELDEVKSRGVMLRQELAQAEVSLERTIYDYQRAEVKAPFDGIVVSREASIGEYTLTGRPLLRLVNTDAAEVSVSAPLRLARFISAGDRVHIQNKDFQGIATVRSLIAVGDSRSHMMEVRVLPEEGDWFIGEAVSVSLPSSKRELKTTVARDAVVLRDHGNFVYVVNSDDTAQRVTVVLGSGFGERIAVSGQLDAGDEVITRGAERLQDGQRVERMGNRISMR